MLKKFTRQILYNTFAQYIYTNRRIFTILELTAPV